MSDLSGSLAFLRSRMDQARKPMGGGYIEFYSTLSKRPPFYSQHGEVDNWLNGLFGTLPPIPANKKPPVVKPDWPEEVFTLSKDLLRTAQFALTDGGLQIDQQTDNFDPRFKELTSQSHSKFLTSADSWLIRSSADGGQTTVQWCDGKERGIFNQTFQLGRLRKAVAEELKNPPDRLVRIRAHVAGRFFPQPKSVDRASGRGPDAAHLPLPGDEKNETLVLIDTKRNVVLSVEESHRREDDLEAAIRRFRRSRRRMVGGKNRIVGRQGRIVTVTRQKIVRLDHGQYVQTMRSRELADRRAVQFLRDPGRKADRRQKGPGRGQGDVRRSDHAHDALRPKRPMDPGDGASRGGRKARRRTSPASAGCVMRC